MVCRRRITVNPILVIVDHNCEMKQSTKICIKSLWILSSRAGASLYYQKFILLFKAPCKRTQRNIAGSCYVLLHEAKSLTGFKLCATTSNNMQQGVQTDATCSILQCCWPTMLRPSTQGLLIHWFALGLLKTRTLESESHGQTNRPHRYKYGKVSRLISDTCDTVDTCFDCEQKVEIDWGLSQSERRAWKLNGFGETIASQQHSHIEFMQINWGFF